MTIVRRQARQQGLMGLFLAHEVRELMVVSSLIVLLWLLIINNELLQHELELNNISKTVQSKNMFFKIKDASSCEIREKKLQRSH